MVTWSCQGFLSEHASPNHDNLGVKFYSKLTFEDHVRGIVSGVFHRVGILRLVKRIYLWTPLCYFVSILPLFSQSLNIVLWCGGQLQNVSFSFLNVDGQALSRSVFCRCVIDVVRLGLVCCTRLIQTLITACSASSPLSGSSSSTEV